MNRVSMFSRSCHRMPLARAKSAVKCSLRLLLQAQKCWMSGGLERGVGRNANEAAAFQPVQLQSFLAMAREVVIHN